MSGYLFRMPYSPVTTPLNAVRDGLGKSSQTAFSSFMVEVASAKRME
jgi:hypothetical protein